MQKRAMIKKAVFIELFTLFLAVVLSACGKEESEEIQEKTFGIDYTEELEMNRPEQAVCGQDGVWTITTVKNDFIYKLGFNTGASELEEIGWQLPEGDYSIINIAERKGTLYAEIWNKEENTLEIRRQNADSGWSDVMSVKAEENEGYLTVGSGFFVDGSENAYLVNGDKVARFDGAGNRSNMYDLEGNVCFFQENGEGHVECVTADADKIALYEFIEGRAEEKWTFKASAGQVHSIRCSEEGMLCLATNQDILFLDRESGSLSEKTDLVKLGVADVLAGYYDAKERTLRLYGPAGNGTEGLYYSLLSERDVSGQQRTELVYGMVGGVNADTAASIWTAITAFNQENKDYYVTIKNYDNNVERLHADMAAGNGPDIIDMTYSEYYESYVKNGYLEDLSPYLERSQYRDDIIWNVMDAYKIDGGLYVFVPQFQLQGLLIHPDYEVDIEEWNMETFLELVEENKWDKDLFGGRGNPETPLYYMLCGRQEEFIDWEQKTASFEMPEFIDILTLCREYADTDWPDAGEWTYNELKWNTLCMNEYFGGSFSYYLFNADVYGREYQIYGYPMISGQTYGIIACSDSCAIYAGSSQKEGAWEFIESLLGESNQKYTGITEPGFPVRSSVLKEMVKESKSMTVRSDQEMLTITDSETQILEDIIYNGNLNSVLINPDIWSVIQEETAPYFAGDKSAEETAHIIQSRVQIILAE